MTDRRTPKNIIDTLARRGPSDRTTLAKELGIGRSTLSRAIGSLLNAHLLIERDLPPNGRGRPRSQLAVDPRRGSAVGFEFGLRHIRGVMIDVSHEILVDKEECLPIDYEVDDALEVLREFLTEFDTAAPGPVLGVGLAVPGPINHRTGILTRSSIMPRWAGRNVAVEMSGHLGRCPPTVGHRLRSSGWRLPSNGAGSCQPDAVKGPRGDNCSRRNSASLLVPHHCVLQAS